MAISNFELIQKYLHRLLNKEDEETFNGRLKKDTDFEAEVKYASMMNAEFNVDQKKRWQQLLAQQNEHAPTQTPSRRALIYYLRRVAAVGLFCLLCFGLYNYNNTSPKENALALVRTEIDAISSIDNTRGNKPLSPEILDKAKKELKEGLYKEAITLLDVVIANGEDKEQAFWYKAIALIQQEEFKSALEMLETFEAFKSSSKSTFHFKKEKSQKLQKLLKDILKD